MAPYKPTSLQLRPSTDDQREYLGAFQGNSGGIGTCMDFITERGIDELAELAHALYEDGLPHGITRTCRTPMRMIYEILCDENLFGSEEALFRFLPKPGKGETTCKYHFVGLLRLLGFRAVCHTQNSGSVVGGIDRLFIGKENADYDCLIDSLEGDYDEFLDKSRDTHGTCGRQGIDRPKAKPKAPKAPKKSKKQSDAKHIMDLMDQVRVLTEENTSMSEVLQDIGYVVCECGKWILEDDSDGGKCVECSQSVPPTTSPFDVLINDDPIPEDSDGGDNEVYCSCCGKVNMSIGTIMDPDQDVCNECFTPESSDDKEWEASSEDDEAEVRGVPMKYMDGVWRVQNNDGSFHPMGKKDIEGFNTGSGLKVLMKHPMYWG